MSNITRYTIRMKNGGYMLQNLDDTAPNRVLIFTVDHPIDSSLLKSREVAKECLERILSGNTNLLALYDEENPPKEVVKLKINVEIEE